MTFFGLRGAYGFRTVCFGSAAAPRRFSWVAGSPRSPIAAPFAMRWGTVGQEQRKLRYRRITDDGTDDALVWLMCVPRTVLIDKWV